MLLLGCPWGQCPIKKQILSMSKETKWWMELPEGFACPIPPSMGPIFVGRRQVIPSHLVNRFGSWFGTNNKLSRGVIGPISTTNDYLNTAYNDVVCLCGSCRNNALSRSPWEKIWLVAILSQRVKSLSLQERNNAICRLPRQIQTYSLG